MAKLPNGVEILPKILTRWVTRTLQTDWHTDERERKIIHRFSPFTFNTFERTHNELLEDMN